MDIPWLAPAYKWLDNSPSPGVTQAFIAGMQNKQNQNAQALQMQELEMRTRALDLDAQVKHDALVTKERKAVGFAALSGVLSTTTDFTDPVQEQKLFAVGIQHPYLADEINTVHANTFVKAKELKARISMANEPPASVQEVQWITRFDEMATALKDVDPTKAAYYRQQSELLKAKMTSDKEATTFGYDDQGRPIMTQTKGGASPLTISTQSQIQQRGLAIEKSVNQAAELLTALQPENVGVSGVVREGVGKTLGQLFPEMVDKQNVDARTLLRLFNERMLPSLKADAMINKHEEERLLKILPSLGAAESIDSAKTAINRIMRELREIARTDARKSNTEMPKWAMQPDEIKELLKEGKIPLEEARSLIQRYHPEFTITK